MVPILHTFEIFFDSFCGGVSQVWLIGSFSFIVSGIFFKSLNNYIP